MLEVVTPGLLTIVTDAGRPAAADLGVPRGGACDPFAWRVLERLVAGDGPSTAALEMSLVGAEFAVLETCVVCLTGADMDARVPEERRELRPGGCSLVRAGTTLRFGAARDGARTYLSLAGGLDLPLVLGSRSTCLAGAFGGIDGRALRVGDRLRPMRPGHTDLAGSLWGTPHSGVVDGAGPRTLRVVPGPHLDRFPAGLLEQLGAEIRTESWTVSSSSDRMGLRLDGPHLPVPREAAFASLPMVWGAVQLPADGRPIVLLADHQTVGGYAVPAVVAAVDRPMLGQLRPGDAVRFEVVTPTESSALLLRADAAFAGARDAMESDREPDPLA